MNGMTKIIDRDPSEYIPLTQACKVHAKLTGRRKKVSRAAMFRWVQSGRRGVYLQACKFDGIYCTTVEWLQDFIHTECPATPDLDSAMNRAEERMTPRPTPTRREVRSMEDTRREAAAMGIW